MKKEAKPTLFTTLFTLAFIVAILYGMYLYGSNMLEANRNICGSMTYVDTISSWDRTGVKCVDSSGATHNLWYSYATNGYYEE